MKCCLVLVSALVVCAHRPAFAQQAPEAPGLTAYRPRQHTGYHPFVRTPVPEGVEEHRQFGPGIRANSGAETDSQGEDDDLIELLVTMPSVSANFVLMRSDVDLAVWGTRRKEAGVGFTGTRSTRLAVGGAQQITLWVEWTGGAPAYPALSLLDVDTDVVVDRIVFHAFTGLVVALGGEDQEPDPADRNHGMFRVGTALYELGWDVLMRDEDDVGPDGSGSVYDDIVNAIQNRSVRQLAVFGYSHGGGSTYDLCELLDIRRPTIGTFSLNFTAYVDAIENDSTIDTDPEARRPPASDFHVNHYQHASPEDTQRVRLEGHGAVAAFAARFLEGGPVAGSTPPPDGLDVESVSWGAETHHYNIDDFDEVHDFIRNELTARMAR